MLRTDRRTTLRRRRSRPPPPARHWASRPSQSTSPKRASIVAGKHERASLRSRRDCRVACRLAVAVGAILAREPWRDCGKYRRSTERPMSTLCHAVALRPRSSSAASAQSRTASHDRVEAKRPGRRRAVKAASRRSRSRAARALTGLRWPRHRRSQAIMAGLRHEHAQPNATLRLMALATLILDAVLAAAAPGALHGTVRRR